VNADAAADKPAFSAGRRRSSAKARKPIERNDQLAPVGQADG
jgi:hypothetical protein